MAKTSFPPGQAVGTTICEAVGLDPTITAIINEPLTGLRETLQQFVLAPKQSLQEATLASSVKEDVRG